MVIQIECYRGWDISFNTEKETFYASCDECDRQETKKSFSSAKKYRDEGIRANTTFEPIWVQTRPTLYSEEDAIKI
jgi:hypothetical protein